MGYSQYWEQEQPFSDVQWTQIKDSTRLIVEYCMAKGISFELYGSEPNAAILDDEIVIGRRDGEPGETFCLSKSRQEFCACKTAREPYDLTVGLILMRASLVAMDVFMASSDGAWDREWLPIRNAYKEIFGTDPDCILQSARMSRALEDRYPILRMANEASSSRRG